MKGRSLLIDKIKQELCSSYENWDRKKDNVILKVGTELANTLDQTIFEIFSDWEKFILDDNRDNTLNELEMVAFIGTYIIFQKDVENRFLKKLLDRIFTENRDVCRVACKYFRLHVENIIDPQSVARKYISESLEAIISESDKYIFCHLSLIASLIDICSNSMFFFLGMFTSQKFLDLLISKSEDIYLHAADILKYVISKINNEAKVSLLEKIITLSIDTETNMLNPGPLSVINCNISNLNHFCNEKFRKLIPYFIKCKSPVFFDIGNYYPGLLNVNDIESFIVGLCNDIGSGEKMLITIKLLERCIKTFHKKIDGDYLLRSLLSFALKNSASLHKDFFNLLKVLIDHFPRLTIPLSFLTKINISTEFLEFLVSIKNPSIEKYIKNITKGVNDSKVIISCAKCFPDLMFDTETAAIDYVTHVIKSQDEINHDEVFDLLSKFDNDTARVILLSFALYDTSKKVRIEAVKKIKPCIFYAIQNSIPQLLYDSSFKACRLAIKLFSELIQYNEFVLVPVLSEFTENTVRMLRNESNLHISAKYASLLPEITLYILPLIPSLKRIVLNTCLESLLLTQSCSDSLYSAELQKLESENEILKPDVTLHPRNTTQKSELQISILHFAYKNYITKRDIYLIKSISNIKDLENDSLRHVLNTFCHFLETRTDEKSLIEGIACLTRLATSFCNGLNIRVHCPKLVLVLTKLLSQTSSSSIALVITKLLGIACDSFSGMNEASEYENMNVVSELMNTSKYFTTFVLDSLKVYFSTPTIELLHAIALVFQGAANIACKELDQIVALFLEQIGKNKKHLKAKLFKFFEVIAVSSKFEFVKYLPQTTNLLFNHLDMKECIHFIVALSCTLLNAFKPMATIMYIPILQKLESAPSDLFKEICQCMAFMIAYQDQPFSMFISAIESLSLVDEEKIESVSRTLCSLIQTVDLRNYTARIVCTAFNFWKRDKKSYMVNLLSTLIKYGELDSSITVGLLQSSGVNFGMPQNIPLDFVKTVLDSKDPLEHSTKEIFTKIDFPLEVEYPKWLEELSLSVIKYSPSSSIRACSNSANNNNTLRMKIFPIAFLSCWMHVSDKERGLFEKIFDRIVNEYSMIDPILVSLVETLDRSGYPMNINVLRLADVSNSHQLLLFLLQRELFKDPNSLPILEKILQFNNLMGRKSAALGAFTRARSDMKPEQEGKWCELLGNWEGALEIYSRSNTNIKGRLRCLYRFERWNDIIDLYPIYQTMSYEERVEESLPFLWAFRYFDHKEEMSSIIRQFHADLPINLLSFRAFFNITSGNYNEALQDIESGFSLIAKNRANVDSGDANLITQSILAAQDLTELQEATYNKSGYDITIGAWKQRIKGFNRSSLTWMKFIQVRMLVVDSSNVKHYIKLISALRKDKMFHHIDKYFPLLSDPNQDPEIRLSYAKVLYARGKTSEALSVLNDLTQSITNGTVIFSSESDKPLLPSQIVKCRLQDSSTKEQTSKLLKLLNLTSEQALIEMFPESDPHSVSKFFITFIINSCGISDIYNLSDNDLKSRIFRLYGNYLVNDVTIYDQMIKGLMQYARSILTNQRDQRNWISWSETCSRIGEMDEINHDAMCYASVIGLLRALKLTCSSTLKILCRMTSLFFRIKDTSLFSEEIINDILNLPDACIELVIPQIVAQLNHQSPITRKIIVDILNKFGQFHPDPVFYPLRMTTTDTNEEKAGIASELLLQLRGNHTEVCHDLEIFVSGLLLASVTCFEEWSITLAKLNEEQHKMNKDVNSSLKALFDSFDHPRCQLDTYFIRYYGEIVNRARLLFAKGTDHAKSEMWHLLKIIYEQVNAQIAKLDAIFLTKISEKLAAKTNFKMAVPGLYSVEGKYPTLHSIENILQVLQTKQHPRCLYFRSSDGQKLKYLLKGNEDIRIDQRIMQFFDLVNSILEHHRLTRNTSATITKHHVIPLSKNAGIISWVLGADTILQIVQDYRSMKNIPSKKEAELCEEYLQCDFGSLNLLQKYDIFKNICRRTDVMDIRETLWIKAPTAAIWLIRTETFTVTTALMSMVGYIIGLGDRHPSNIMIQRQTGRVIHIDFGDCFERTMLRSRYPENVPFRLTRMIVNALDNCSIEGMFRDICSNVMNVIRENRNTLYSQLEIFLYDPIDDAIDDKNFVMDRISKKLRGYETDQYETVGQQVDRLIRDASNPFNFVSHFPGWCIFW